MAYQDPPTPQNEGEGSGQVTLSRDQIRSMERDAKQARTLLRENAMLRAGINTDTPLGQLFATAYEGDLDPEAIKTAWAAVAPAPADPPPPPPPSSEDPPVPPEGAAEFEEERQRLLTGGGGDDGTPPDRDPRKAAVEAGNRMLAEGKSRDEAMAEAFATIASGAAAGDSRVIVR